METPRTREGDWDRACHLLVNRPPFDKGGAEELSHGQPADDHRRHFGCGQTEATVELPPGRHRLQLVLGDHNHVPKVPRSCPR
ncbi:DUF4399 domain-containing protein [Roseovarius autotrophicus]|uniref:DUF4399 domain-containing protein n=1 Tax=Roseovarius autotrophicus TaxID=2824121 RepID=UPI001FFCA039|nr:DUF4399 domain-containing protein [Roseovarius autotrophicus]